MTHFVFSYWLPWIVSVVMSFVLSYYLNQLFLLQYSVQVHFSYTSKFNKSYKVTITNESRMNESNGKSNHLYFENNGISTHGNDMLTPIQLKDFGKYPKNRKNSVLFLIHRV